MSDSALERRTRRVFLTGGIAGLAALVANAVLRPLPVEAAGNVVMGVSNDAGQFPTEIHNDAATTAFTARNLGAGTALEGFASDSAAVSGHGPTGIFGTSNNGGISVHGAKYDGMGPAVKGENSYSLNGYAAVYGLTNGTGPAVYGEGTAQGNGTSGVARGTGSGVYGQSDNGRGGRFKGKKAQIRLEPATTTTHPASGDAGDIYLDKSKRLWLCKGGTSWVRLDL